MPASGATRVTCVVLPVVLLLLGNGSGGSAAVGVVVLVEVVGDANIFMSSTAVQGT